MSRSSYAGVMIIAFVVTFFFMSFSNAARYRDIKGYITSHRETELRMPAATAIRGYMDTLYVDIPTFLSLAPKKRRLVFKYYITDEDSLTLHGWRTKKNNVDDYDYDPDELILKNGGADLTIPFGPKSFLGGVVLTKEDVGTIRDYIAAHPSMRFVMFKPQKDPSHAGHVYYDIYLIDYEPRPGIIHALTAPLKVGNVGANPSPPRKS